MLANWDSHPAWLDRGGIDARTRANAVWKQLLAEHQDPPLDPGIDAALSAYVARRKAEGGAPMN
jgi:trimethylamine--corrinoid protein Co-methyltransferase